MSTDNPYAPAQAQVADVAITAEPSQPVGLWTARGRVGRLRLLAFNSAAYLIFWLLMGLTAGVTVAFVGGRDAVGVGAFIIMLAMGAVFFVFSALQLIKRCHDLNWSGWLWLLAILPIVNLIFVLMLLLIPGKKTANRYGPPPPPNRPVHWVLGSVVPVMVFVGLLGAIAIPQYQAYLERARSAQGR
ncbi:MAG TPA: DUF805 domain-containing protein [Burkholderiaceae bacterium]|nr:DUF805 domain-containing protein [Burkholderiaceae bacterium]